MAEQSTKSTAQIRRSALLGLTLAGWFGMAAAEIDTTSELLACEKIGDEKARLSCFESVVEKIRSKTIEPAAADRPIEPTVMDRPEKQPVVDRRIDRNAEGRQSASEPRSETPVRPPEPADDEVELIESMEAPTVADSPGLYERKKDSRNERLLVPFQAIIEKVRVNHDGRFSVTLDNGQVWRETQGSRVRTPRTGQSVKVYRGGFGGYRMKIDGIPRVAWVRQTK